LTFESGSVLSFGFDGFYVLDSCLIEIRVDEVEASSLTGVPEGGIRRSADGLELLEAAFRDSETLFQKYRGNSEGEGVGEGNLSSESVEGNGSNNTFKLNDSDLTLLLALRLMNRFFQIDFLIP
jgi:hypothetical protein